MESGKQRREVSEGGIADERTENTIRDLYDITIAARLEPRSMASVLHKLAKWSPQRALVKKSLEETPTELHETDPKPIIGARYDLELSNLAQRLIPMIESSDPDKAPTTLPLPNTDGIKSGKGQER